MNVILSHGIRAMNRQAHMGELRDELTRRGVHTLLAPYGYILFPITNGKAKRALRKATSIGDILVGYSNGAAAVLKEAERLKAGAVLLLSPAARCDTQPPACRADVFYSPGDWAVELGGLYSGAVSLMPWRWGTPHGWGRMGADGPCVEGYNVHQWPERICHNWYENSAIVHGVADRIEVIKADLEAKHA
mgnify:CR=1 FL=1